MHVMATHYRDTANIAIGEATQVMGQALANISQLPIAGAAVYLLVDFIDHAQACRTQRVAKALQAPVYIARQCAVAVVLALDNIPASSRRARTSPGLPW